MVTRQRTSAKIAVARALLAPPTDSRGHYGAALIRTTGVLAGTLYPMLQQFVEDGWIEALGEGGSPVGGSPRRLYSVTPEGLEALGRLARERT